MDESHPLPFRTAQTQCAARRDVVAADGGSDGFAQGRPPRSPLETLTEEFTDPLMPLPQILLQDAYAPANYGTNAQTNRLIARAIVPRIPRFSLFPFYQLIRPQFSLVSIPTSKGSSTRTEFGDIDLVDLAILPWPDPMGMLKVGMGPTLSFRPLPLAPQVRVHGRLAPRLLRPISAFPRPARLLPQESDFLRLHLLKG